MCITFPGIDGYEFADCSEPMSIFWPCAIWAHYESMPSIGFTLQTWCVHVTSRWFQYMQNVFIC